MILYEDPKIAKYNSNLKKIRIMRCLTQEQLAELSTTNIKSLSAYEQCPEKLINASVLTLYKLSQVLNCEIEDLLNKDILKENI